MVWIKIKNTELNIYKKNTKIFLIYGKLSEDESVSTNGKRFVKPMENAIH